MKYNDNSGGGMVSVLFVLLFIASVALNAILLVGCNTLPGRQKWSGGIPWGKQPGPTRPDQSSEVADLKEIAQKLGINVPSDNSPDNIAFLIKQRLGDTIRYRGAVLSEESASDVQAQILEPSDAQAFADYHAFIQGIEDKKILILE